MPALPSSLYRARGVFGYVALLFVANAGSAGVPARKNTLDATNAGEDARAPNLCGDGAKNIRKELRRCSIRGFRFKHATSLRLTSYVLRAHRTMFT